MTLYSHVLVYPEGDKLEIQSPLTFNQLVDLNGNPIRLPITSEKTILYSVYKISTSEKIGEEIKYYHLELVKGEELFNLAGKTLPTCKGSKNR